jgi:hypothetical protein
LFNGVLQTLVNLFRAHRLTGGAGAAKQAALKRFLPRLFFLDHLL